MNGDLPANSTEQTEEDRLMDWDGTHPLSNSWVLWYSDRSTSKEWKDCIKEIGPFHTIEGFWSVFNHLKPMSNLKPGCDFYMFKMGILPMWEDKANKNGGRWDIQFERGIMREQIDTFWMELVMALVGEAFSAIGNIVTGACVTSRDKYSRISIWTSMANDKEKLIRLGRKVKQVLGLTHDQRIFFRTHEDSANSTYRQNGSISV